MIRWSRLSVLAVALALSTQGIARAQSGEDTVAAPESPFKDEVAKKHYEDGQAADAKGNWQEAYTSYRAGFAVEPNYLLAGALGNDAYRLNRFREAAEFITIYLQSAPASMPERFRTSARKMFELARQHCGTLTISAPAGSDVFVDGVLVGKAPLGRDVFVEAGDREVEARSDKDSIKVAVTAEQGKSSPVSLVFGAAPKPTAKPSASASAPVAVEGPRQEVVIGGASVAAGAVALGAVLLGISQGKAAEEDTLRRELVALGKGNVCAGATRDPRCAQIRDTASSVDSLTNTGGWLVIGGAVAGAGTLLYYLVTRQPNPPRVEAAAAITPHFGGGTVTVRW